MSSADEILFISDCHLVNDGTETSRLLIKFLEERALTASQLYILGDLFEVWLGDDDPAGENQLFLAALDRLAETCEVLFIAGNRDFLIGETFASRHRLTVLQEPIQLRLGQQKVALMHGDSLCTDDIDYQNFRSMVRTTEWQQNFLAKPLVERKAIAAALRDDSKAAMKDKTSQIMDANDQAVIDCFNEHGIDVLVHGHTHRPARHDHGNGRIRYVLGDWSPGPSYLSWTAATGFKLFDFRFRATA